MVSVEFIVAHAVFAVISRLKPDMAWSQDPIGSLQGRLTRRIALNTTLLVPPECLIPTLDWPNESKHVRLASLGFHCRGVGKLYVGTLPTLKSDHSHRLQLQVFQLPKPHNLALLAL